jgi:NAD(P)-dependent dehydrogenase (short-subunit alcohol dehydrogenase family)
MAPRSNYIIEANADDTMEAFRVNTIGPMVLFKSFHLLLKASSHAKFVIVSSGAGSMGDGRVAPFPIIEYAMSKTAVNYLAWKIHHEHADVIAFSLK